MRALLLFALVVGFAGGCEEPQYVDTFIQDSRPRPVVIGPSIEICPGPHCPHCPEPYCPGPHCPKH